VFGICWPPHIQDIAGKKISISEIRFGGGSGFGFKNPSPFFDLDAIRSQSPITWIGIGSVSVTAKWGHRKSVWILRLSDAMATSAGDS
jgi:hypothetical protein